MQQTRPRFDLAGILRSRTFYLWLGVYLAGALVGDLIAYGMLAVRVDLTPLFNSLITFAPLFLLQAVMLARTLYRFPGRSWFIRTCLTYFGAFALANIFLTIGAKQLQDNRALSVIVVGAILGATVGFAQSLILQNYIGRSELWIVAATLTMITLLGSPEILSGTGLPVLAFTLDVLIKGLVGGVVSGTVLCFLLSEQEPEAAIDARIAAVKPMTLARRLKVIGGCTFGFILLLLVFAFMHPVVPRRATAKEPASASATSQKAVAAWESYTSNGGLFSVLLPGAPSENSRTLPSGVGEQYQVTSHSDSAIYAVLYTDRPTGLPDRNADDLFDGMTENEQLGSPVNRLTHSTDLTWQGYPGREIELELEDGSYARIWMILSDTHVYEVVTYAHDREEASDEIDGFLHSFKILPSVDM